MLFVKSAKIFAAAIALAPLSGCAIATGSLFGQLLIASAHSPDLRNAFFANTLLAFALIETFCFFCLGVALFCLFF